MISLHSDAGRVASQSLTVLVSVHGSLPRVMKHDSAVCTIPARVPQWKAEYENV